MGRKIGAVLAGMVVWAVIVQGAWAACQAALPAEFDADGFATSSGIYVAFLVLSVVASIAAGWVTAAVAGGALGPVWALGAIQLAIGVAVQTSVWDRMPLWYHVPFLLLLVPGNLLGGWMRASRRETALA